ncbi:MAG: DUF4200 domain-containing protein [Verrucomicrobiales bacterium]
MLEKDPAARFASFGELVDSIDDCLESLGETPGAVAPAICPKLLGEAEATSPSAAADPNPEELPPIGSFFQLGQGMAVDELGAYYTESADLKTQLPVELLVLNNTLPGDAGDQIRRNIDRLERNPHRFLLPMSRSWFREGETIIRHLPESPIDLFNAIRMTGAIPLRDASEWIEGIAAAFDHASLNGLPGVESNPRFVFVQTPSGRKFGNSDGDTDWSASAPLVSARLYSPPEGGELDQVIFGAGSFIGTCTEAGPFGSASSSGPVSDFAALIYWFLAAWEATDFARISSAGYRPSNNVSAEVNRLLAAAIAGESECRDCLSLAREILESEGLSPLGIAPPVPPPAGAEPAEPRRSAQVERSAAADPGATWVPDSGCDPTDRDRHGGGSRSFASQSVSLHGTHAGGSVAGSTAQALIEEALKKTIEELSARLEAYESTARENDQLRIRLEEMKSLGRENSELKLEIEQLNLEVTSIRSQLEDTQGSLRKRRAKKSASSKTSKRRMPNSKWQNPRKNRFRPNWSKPTKASRSRKRS